MGKVEVPKNSKAQALKKEFKAKVEAAAKATEQEATTSSSGRKLYDDGDINSGNPRHVWHNKGEQCTFIRLRSDVIPTDWRTDMVMPLFPGDHWNGNNDKTIEGFKSWGIRLLWDDNTDRSADEYLMAIAIYFFEQDFDEVDYWDGEGSSIVHMEFFDPEDKDYSYDCTPEWRVNGLLNMIYYDSWSCYGGSSSYGEGGFYSQWWSAIGYTSPSMILADAWQMPDFPPANGPLTKWGDQYEYYCPSNNGKEVIVLAHRTDKQLNCKAVDPEYSYWWTVTHGANCKRIPYKSDEGIEVGVQVGGLVFDTACVMPPNFQYCPYSGRTAQEFIYDVDADWHCWD
jgi:hypothetical protein